MPNWKLIAISQANVIPIIYWASLTRCTSAEMNRLELLVALPHHQSDGCIVMHERHNQYKPITNKTEIAGTWGLDHQSDPSLDQSLYCSIRGSTFFA